MGLDVTAYETATLIRACSSSEMSDDDWDQMDGSTRQFLSNVCAFAERGDGLAEGVYEVTGAFHWHGGSYHGYNAWRHELCVAALAVEPEAVWANPVAFAPHPFVSLIHFSDCEGFLGPLTRAGLAADFAIHPDLDARMGDGGWGEVNAEWRKGFDLAAGSGVVVFH